MTSDEKAVQGSRTPYSGASPSNVLDFVNDQQKKDVYTALPVTVQAVYPGETTGYVDVLPLVGTYDGKKQLVPPVTLYHVPYSRIQGGAAALIIDPVVGDKGLAVFCMQDVSSVTAETSEPQQPGSYRDHSMSDGYYIGGFLNQRPAVYVSCNESGVININTNGGTCNIQTGTCNITAPGGVNITGDVAVTGSTTISGTLDVVGAVTGAGVGLSTHVHSGVESGPSDTGGPHG